MIPAPFPGLSHAPVAQLDRVLPSEGRGHRFESCRARQSFQSLIRSRRHEDWAVCPDCAQVVPMTLAPSSLPGFTAVLTEGVTEHSASH